MSLPQGHNVLSEPARPVPPLSRRRDKPQLSCTLCRKAKLKCDRGLPCDSCARRGLSLSCAYPASAPLQSGKRVIRPSPAMHERVAQLETLVLSLKKQASDTTNHEYPARYLPQDSVVDIAQLPKSFGRISLENTETTYVEGSHWTAILDNIAELKDYFDDADVSETANTVHRDSLGMEPSFPQSGPALVLGNFQPIDRPSLIATVPPRPTVDRLVAKYFNSKNINSLLIHGPTFLEEYHQFWEYPQKTSTMWIGLLYAIMCLAASTEKSERELSGPSTSHVLDMELSQSIHTYRLRTVQCLSLADYTKCVPYTVETLSHYLCIEYLNAADSQTGAWILMGIIVQIAIRMGYHRDGSHSPRLSPFQSEMRRRAWAIIFQIDSAAAGQYGLPRMINDSQADTREPRDVNDDALSRDMSELPPPRNGSEPSNIQFLVMKNRLVSTLNMIIDLTGSPKKVASYDEILKLDKILVDQFQEMPVPLRMRPMSRSLTDTPEVIVNRIFLALSYYKSRCILHRGYMLAAQSNDRYMYSWKSCIQSALEILHIQLTLHEESQEGRRLYHEKWKYYTLIKHIWLLATTILCADLDNSLQDFSGRSQYEGDSFEKIVQALRNSYFIWLESSDMSRDAQKAAQMLRVVLKKIPDLPSQTDNSSSGSVSGASNHSAFFSKDPSSLLHNKTSFTNNFAVSSGLSCDPPFSPPSPLLGGSEGVDTLDHIQGLWDLSDWTGQSTMDEIISQSEDWSKLDLP